MSDSISPAIVCNAAKPVSSVQRTNHNCESRWNRSSADAGFFRILAINHLTLWVATACRPAQSEQMSGDQLKRTVQLDIPERASVVAKVNSGRSSVAGSHCHVHVAAYVHLYDTRPCPIRRHDSVYQTLVNVVQYQSHGHVALPARCIHWRAFGSDRSTSRPESQGGVPSGWCRSARSTWWNGVPKATPVCGPNRRWQPSAPACRSTQCACRG